MGKITGFRDLHAWQKAHALAVEVYMFTKKFPPDERFGLTNQMRRAVVSVGSNIAEGYSRGTAKDKNHFYLMGRGSLSELESQLLLARDLGYFKESEKIFGQIDDVVKLLVGLMKSSANRHYTTY